MSWIFYIFLSVNFFAIANLTDKFLVSKKFKSIYSLAVVLNILYLIFNIILGFFIWKTVLFGWPFFWAVLASAFYYLMWIFWLKALQTGEISRLSAIFFTQPIFIALLAMIFLKESVMPIKWLAIIIIVIGAILSSWENKKTKTGFNSAYIFILLSTIFSSIGNVVSKHAMAAMPALTVQVIGYFVALPFFLILLINKQVFLEVKKTFSNLKFTSFLFLRSLVGYVGICLFMLAIGAGPVAFVSALSATQPIAIFICSTLLSFFAPKIIKEETTKGALFTKAVAIILIVTGAIIISLF